MKIYNGEIVLLAHLTLDPNDFRAGKKTKASKVTSGERESYWRESLAQAGVDHLHAIYTGQWLVSVADIHQEAVMQRLVKPLSHSKSRGSIGAGKRLIPDTTIGGLSLMHNGKIIAPSMCCDDLTSIDNWRVAATHRHAEWYMLWNGHPSLYVRYERDQMIFSDPSDDKPTSLTAGRFAIPVGLLQQAVDQANQDIDLFLERFDAYMRSTTI